jgi:transposase
MKPNEHAHEIYLPTIRFYSTTKNHYLLKTYMYRNCAENVENYVKKNRGSLHQHLICRKHTEEYCEYIKKKLGGLTTEILSNVDRQFINFLRGDFH